MARHCRVSDMPDSTGILSATVTATYASWDPDSGTGERTDDDEDDDLAYAILSEGIGEETAMRQALELQIKEQSIQVEELRAVKDKLLKENEDKARFTETAEEKVEALNAVRDQLLKAKADQVRVSPSTELNYVGHSLSSEATAMRNQMLVCEHTIMGRGHLHTSENGDNEFRPNCEGDTNLIKITDETGKEVFVFMP